ncbi:hypothetical protein HOY82DRAFT_597374 [Tuber indicum]|nr:hypothetical protein HOY82DRAFT_597374 [Tuber indicum]
MGKSEPSDDEPADGEEKVTLRELSDQAEEDNSLAIRDSKDTSTTFSGTASVLPGGAVTSPGGVLAQAHLSRPQFPPLLLPPVAARVPNDNNLRCSHHTISITIPTSGSNYLDPVASSSTTPASVNAPSTVLPVQHPVQKRNAIVANKRKRVTQDIVGQQGNPIAEDPRGDIDAWLVLIEEQRKKVKMDDVRSVYEMFL